MSLWLGKSRTMRNRCRGCVLLALLGLCVIILVLYILLDTRLDGGAAHNSDEVELYDSSDNEKSDIQHSQGKQENSHIEDADLNQEAPAGDIYKHVKEGIKSDKLSSNSDTESKMILIQNTDTNFEGVSTVFAQAFDALKKLDDHTTYNMNTAVSVSMSAVRNVPDTRPTACHNVSQSLTGSLSDLPPVSIVIPYYLEHWSTLLRTLQSIYTRTQSHLVHEIILVDDFNPDDELQQTLRPILKQLPKVNLLRTRKREGLIRARMIGSRAAEADVLVILDAHVEVNRDWLPPLLMEILRNRKTIAVPALDVIDANTMKYNPWLTADFGSFDWELDYKWIRMPKVLEDQYQAGQSVPTATLLGSAMAVDRQYWVNLGGFDEGLDIWGGENMELSFKTWMCGGQLRIIPCSRIGHLFRSHLPYIANMDVIYKNLQRVAEVWMDEYKKYYFQTTNKSFRLSDSERKSLKQRKHLRDILRCNDFSWYLDNIAKTVHPPALPSVLFGSFRSLSYRACLTINQSNRVLTLKTCGVDSDDQVFYLTPDHRIQLNSTSCLTFTDPHKSTQAIIARCSTDDLSQKWLFSPIVPNELKDTLDGVDTRKTVGRFMCHHGQYTNCLQALSHNGITSLFLQSCDPYSPSQYWIISHEIHETVKIINNLSDS